MELQEIRIAWFLGLAALWILVLAIGAGVAAFARALDHARDVVAVPKEPR
jgi:hypothetical protein